MSSMYRFDWLPKPLYLRLKHLAGRTQFFGKYPTWQAALAESRVYKTDIASHRDLIRPEGAPLQQWAVAVGLLMPPLSQVVLDFGGGVGSLYYELRTIFAPQWFIVDLPEIVEYGKGQLEDECLRFFLSIDDAVKEKQPDAIVSSSVLQFLPEPYETIRSLASLGASKIVFNRTLVAEKERIMIQRVPKFLGGGARPVRFLEESRLLHELRHYRLFSSFDWRHRDGNLYGKYKHMSYIFIRS